MRDIVERLRQYGVGIELEAADEIERLRNERDVAVKERSNAREQVYAANDEIERLRAVCRYHAGVELSEENDRLIDEIKRAEAELKKAHHLVGQSIQWQRNAEIKSAKQNFEIERLKSLLRHHEESAVTGSGEAE